MAQLFEYPHVKKKTKSVVITLKILGKLRSLVREKRTWKRRIIVQIKPNVNRGFPSTMSSAPIDSKRT